MKDNNFTPYFPRPIFSLYVVPPQPSTNGNKESFYTELGTPVDIYSDRIHLDGVFEASTDITSHRPNYLPHAIHPRDVCRRVVHVYLEFNHVDNKIIASTIGPG